MIAVLGKDLMPINRSLTALKSDALQAQERFLFLIILCFFPLGYFGIVFIRKHQQKIKADTGYVRRGKAYKTFQKDLKHLKGDGKFFEQASMALRSYLGNKLNMDGGALTSIDIQRKLDPHLSGSALTKITEYLKQCEQGQYGGKSTSKEMEKNMKSTLFNLVKGLEKEV